MSDDIGPRSLHYDLLCHLPRTFPQAAAFAQEQVSSVGAILALREGTSHAAGGPCIQLLYFHASGRFPHLPSLSSFPVYFMNSSQVFPFSHQRLWEFIILLKESICPISPTSALHVYPLIPLSNHTLFSLCFFTRALISSLSKDFTCHAFHCFSSH